jgi:hypothetical protein
MSRLLQRDAAALSVLGMPLARLAGAGHQSMLRLGHPGQLATCYVRWQHAEAAADMRHRAAGCGTEPALRCAQAGPRRTLLARAAAPASPGSRAAKTPGGRAPPRGGPSPAGAAAAARRQRRGPCGGPPGRPRLLPPRLTCGGAAAARPALRCAHKRPPKILLSTQHPHHRASPRRRAAGAAARASDTPSARRALDRSPHAQRGPKSRRCRRNRRTPGSPCPRPPG